MDAPNIPGGLDEQSLRQLKHHIKNQLSNINLAIEQLRYEFPGASEDATFYIDMVMASCAKIDNVLNAAGQSGG